MNKASINALKIFTVNKNKYHQQILIIVTDGLTNDIDELKKTIEQLEKNNVYILVCYFSKFSSNRLLYDDIQNANIREEGAKAFFDMSTRIYIKDPFFKSFLTNGWVSKTKYCRLFIGVNNESSMKEFSLLLNKLLTFEDAVFDNIIKELGKMAMSSFIYTYNINVFQSKNQIFGTCWANACAACIHFALRRIIGRKEKSFEDIRKHLIVNYSLNDEDGNFVDEVLEKVVEEYGLKMKELFTDEEAKEALKNGRPCVATFSLNANQWANFSDFFKEKYNRKQCLTKERINQKNDKKDKPGGHAVVLIDAHEDELVFLNSWGMEFGDLGKFRIKNGDVLTNADKPYEKIRYFDIFWYESDLKAEEINAYKKYIEDVYQSLYYLMCKEEKIKQLDNKEIKCEKCTGVSKAHCFLGEIHFKPR